MNFKTFKTNIEDWATERGIYKHSTPQAQLLKSLSELGELADAVIKDDRNGLIDAIGDVAVCMVNYAKMVGMELDTYDIEMELHEGTYIAIGDICDSIAWLLLSNQPQCLEAKVVGVFEALGSICVDNDLRFEVCCLRKRLNWRFQPLSCYGRKHKRRLLSLLRPK